MREVNAQILIRKNLLSALVIILETILGDIFGFNDHEFSFVGINRHTHLGEVVLESLKVSIKVVMDFCKKHDIINIEEESNENTNKLDAHALRWFQTLL